MKKLTCEARVIRVSPVFAPDGSPLYRRGRLITHRAILAFSQSFEDVLAACKKLTRLTPEEAAQHDRQFSDRPAAFCLKRNDGLYALDLNANQIGLVTGGRMPVALFQFIAPHTSLRLSVELRDKGDVVIDRQGKELPVVQGHAAIQDLTALIPPAVEEKMLQYMVQATMQQAPQGFAFGAGTPTGGSAFSVPADSPLDEEDSSAHPSATRPTTANVARDAAGSIDIGAPAPSVDAPYPAQEQQKETVSRESSENQKNQG